MKIVYIFVSFLAIVIFKLDFQHMVTKQSTPSFSNFKMDSFYDVPRRAPVPTPVEKLLAAPVVPEVSMLCPVNAPLNNYTPYNTWKMQQNPSRNILSSNKENIIRVPQNGHPIRFVSPQNTSQFLKKQVRFESPVLQQRPSLTYEPFNPRRIGKIEDKHSETCEKSDVAVKDSESRLNGKTFEEIYMANVPTRQLDLSIIELPNNVKKTVKPSEILEKGKQDLNSKPNLHTNIELESEIQKNKENQLPRTYREFLETQKKTKESKVNHNDSITDIFNYKRSKNFSDCKSTSEVKKYPTKDHLSKTNVAMNSVKNDVVTMVPLPENQKFAYEAKKTCYAHTVENQQSPHLSLCNKPHLKVPTPSYQHPENGYQSNFLRKFADQSQKSDSVTQTSIAYLPPKDSEQSQTPKNDSEPTNKDLLKIIAQQNEQLLILQKQVAMLINRDQQTQCKPIEAGPQATQKAHYIGEKCVTSTQNENFRNPMQDVTTPRKRGLSKFSIDMMTSFEVAIRPQHNKQNFINYEPKIQEVTETESVATGVELDKGDKTVVDTSLHLQEPVRVREVCPSPEPSININMNDYDSSEDDEVSALEIGATFYRNLMGQVNNILKKAQVQTKEELTAREGGKNGVIFDKFREQTMSRVKEATLKHLKSIGVTIGPMDDNNESFSVENDSKDYNPAEVSFAVKQILMKYLPDDQLAKFAYKQAQSVPANKDERPGIIPTRPEFSFASVQYMKKYNLIPNNDKRERDLDQICKPAQKIENPKILDITALKMQPKLL